MYGIFHLLMPCSFTTLRYINTVNDMIYNTSRYINLLTYQWLQLFLEFTFAIAKLVVSFSSSSRAADYPTPTPTTMNKTLKTQAITNCLLRGREQVIRVIR